MATTIIIESIPQGIFRDIEKSSSSSDTPLMMNVNSFDTMDTIETILDESMAVEDIAALSQKRGLFKRFRSQRSIKSAKKEDKEQKAKGRKLMGRLSFGNKRSQAKLLVVETQPKMVSSSYTVASEESPVHDESAEIKVPEVPPATTATTSNEVVDEVSHTEEIVESITPEVHVVASTDDVTTAEETPQEVVDLPEVVDEVPEEIKMPIPVELLDDAVVEDSDQVAVQMVSIHSDDLVLTMEFDEDEVETSEDEIVEDHIMPEKAPYHQDSADYVGLALVGFFVALLASPMFQMP